MVHPEAVAYLKRIQAVPYGPDIRAWVEGVLPVYVEMLENRVHFAQAAYRDGEFAWITGESGALNANGELWEFELSERLAHTLLRPVGQWCAYFEPQNPRRPAADAWLKRFRPPVEWIADRPFARASEQGMAAPFFKAIRGRKICVVGPEHLLGLPYDLMAPVGYIYVPPATAWKEADRLASLVTQSECDLFLIAAGSAANLMIHAAWPEIRDTATLVDVGAMLDPYAGVFSRNLYRRPEWQKHVFPKNLRIDA